MLGFRCGFDSCVESVFWRGRDPLVELVFGAGLILVWSCILRGFDSCVELVSWLI